MEFRVKDLLNLDSLKNASVLSGTNELNQPIKGITIMEAPDIADWLKGGELILTSLYPIRNFNGEEQRDFVSRLVRKGASALVIKNHRFVLEIPEPMITEGNKLGLPIIQIPKEVPYVDVMYPVMGELFNRQVKKLQYFKEIHDQFTVLSLTDKGPEQIIKTLEELIGNPVALLDRNFHSIFATDPSLAKFELVEKVHYYEKTKEIKLPHYRQVVKYPDLQGLSGYQIVVPVENFNHMKTYLLIGEMNKPLEEIDFIAVENAATSLSLELVKQFAVAEVEKKFKKDLIDELVSGKFQSVNLLFEKANVFGWDLEGSFSAVLFKMVGIKDTSKGRQISKRPLQQKLSSMFEAIHQYLPKGIMTSKGDTVIVLWKVEEGHNFSLWSQKIKKAAYEVQKLIKKQIGDITVQVGIGNIADNILEIARSYKEAQEALELGKTVFGEETVTMFSELGIFRLLCNFGDLSSLSSYIPVSLKRLINYPHSNQADLIKTLRVFLECNQNATKTSQILFLHYKTVVYRLERIKEITRMKFEDPEEMLSVHVGLKIMELLDRENRISLPKTGVDKALRTK
jgi:purine catabolism regulator